MAANILKQSRAVSYFPTMRAVVNHLRRPLMSTIATASNLNQSPQDFGPFTAKDPRFPLPGNMNIDVNMCSEIFQIPENQQSLASAFLDVETNEMNKDQVLAQFLHNTQKDNKMKAKEINENNSKEVFENATGGKVECSMQKCSASLQRSFSDLFPERKFEAGEMTVVSICQHTKNDMTVWSQDVDAEREELLKNFIESATEICDLLKSQGYWADFIDPSSGNAYFGAYSNSTFFETDERYNQLGYRVLDLGCCKALSHNIWGTCIYVGSIFTNAPVESLSLHTVLGDKK